MRGVVACCSLLFDLCPYCVPLSMNVVGADWIARMCRRCRWDVQVKTRPVTKRDAQSVVRVRVGLVFHGEKKW